MLIRLAGGEAPLFMQIADALRAQIASGTVVVGERLPAARDLAAGLDVNLHTVLKAYQALRDEGVIEMRRGRGAVVADAAAALVDVNVLAHEFATRARAAGLGADVAAALVREAMSTADRPSGS